MEGSFHGDFELRFWGVETEIFRLRRPEFTPFFACAKERRQNPLTRNLRKKARSGGGPPRSEFILSSLSRDENMNSRRLRPPRPPGNGQAGRGSDRGGVYSGKRFGIRGKRRLFGKPRGTIPTLASPLRGRCRRSRRMRCRFRLRNRLQTKM